MYGVLSYPDNCCLCLLLQSFDLALIIYFAITIFQEQVAAEDKSSVIVPCSIFLRQSISYFYRTGWIFRFLDVATIMNEITVVLGKDEKVEVPHSHLFDFQTVFPTAFFLIMVINWLSFSFIIVFYVLSSSSSIASKVLLCQLPHFFTTLNFVKLEWKWAVMWEQEIDSKVWVRFVDVSLQ